jgi:predicted RNA-binding Zn-ribbon protein involved in translation (DUF1610 family)
MRQGVAAGRWGALGRALTDDELPELAFSCPECGEAEFGDD